MRKLALACLAALVAFSCVGIDSRLTVRNDGSGALSLTYHVARSLADLGRTEDSEPLVPLPIERDDFDRALADAPGLRLERFSRSLSKDEVTIRADLAFDRLENLARFAPFAGTGLTLSQASGVHTLTQTVYRARKEPPNAETLTMVDNLFQGYDLTFSLTVPAAITAHSIGTVSAGERTLTWRATIPDLVRANQDVMLTVSW